MAQEISVPRTTPSGPIEALSAHALAETTSQDEVVKLRGNIAKLKMAT